MGWLIIRRSRDQGLNLTPIPHLRAAQQDYPC